VKAKKNEWNKKVFNNVKKRIITGISSEVLTNTDSSFLFNDLYSTVKVSPTPMFINGAIKYTEFKNMVIIP